MSTPTLTKETETRSGPAAAAGTATAETPAPRRAPRKSTAARLRLYAAEGGKAVWGAGAIILFLLLWELGPTYLAPASTRVFLPPLHVVLEALGTLVANGQ